MAVSDSSLQRTVGVAEAEDKLGRVHLAFSQAFKILRIGDFEGFLEFLGTNLLRCKLPSSDIRGLVM